MSQINFQMPSANSTYGCDSGFFNLGGLNLSDNGGFGGRLDGLDLLNGGGGGSDNFGSRHYCRTRRELARPREVKGGRKDRTKKTYVERELIARERESCVLRRLWAERENRKEGIESYSNLDAASFYLLQSVYALFGREPYFQGRRYVPYFSIPSSRP